MFNSNASSADAGGANYIEDVFSTWLYTGNGATQTIANGIDLSGKGGLTWIKSRSYSEDHCLFDTARGALNVLYSDTTDGSNSLANSLTAFTSTGFTLGSRDKVNTSAATYASWTFREQPKFFDVVTYSGTSSNQTISHNLGSVPGCIMIKTLNATDDWMVYHRSTTATQYLSLNQTIAAQTLNSFMNNTEPTSTVFTVGTTGGVNNPGTTYIAYLFAHNAGGFGLTGTDDVISCGSYTANTSSGVTVTLGWEPQWLLVKNAGIGNGGWVLMDNMRQSLTVNATSNSDLYANSSLSETSPATATHPIPTATGFFVGAGVEGEFNYNSSGASGTPQTFIYIAIRRGPMKLPTTGTSVFIPVANSLQSFTSNFPVDFVYRQKRAADATNYVGQRLTGNTIYLNPQTTDAEYTTGVTWGFANNTGLVTTGLNGAGNPMIWYAWQRAPSFMDIVCYTGTGSNLSVSHNLTVAPQLAIVKKRNGIAGWVVGSPLLSNTAYSFLNDSLTFTTSGGNSNFQNTAWSSQYLYVGDDGDVNGSGQKFVAYLFATCAGVSKVGTYTGTATTKQIDCGFAAGSRFVMIKRTDSAGDWYIWDSARGIIAGNDPYLLINSTAGEVTGTDYVDTYAAGFELSSTAPAALNASGGTYLFLAIA
jgi:hypothetical protein